MAVQGMELAVYGATGHTGRFVVAEALRRGLAVRAVGRRAMPASAGKDGFPPMQVAPLDDPDRLRQAFAGCAVVVNCAGPFLDTAAPVAAAALDERCHYIDVTAEQASALATLRDFDAVARAAGRVVMPAAGFFGGLADLLASALAQGGAIESITVAVAVDRWWPTAGTRRTGERNTAPRQVVREGRLVPLDATAGARDWRFAEPIGPQAMTALPFSEIVTLAHHLPARRIDSLFNLAALADIRDPETPPPTVVDARGRSAQRFEVAVELTQDGRARRATARGQDIYAVTAPLVVEAALRLAATTGDRAGASTLGQALPAREVLQALHGRDLLIAGDLDLS